MARFSVTEAATAGFGVIARKPLALAGWAAALIVAVVVPTVLCLLALGPHLHQIIEMALANQGNATPDPEDFQRMMQAQTGMTGVNLLFWLWSSFVKAVFAAAVFRAVLTPDQSAWAYLRLGSRELWLALLLLVEQVLAMIVIFVVTLLVVVVTAVVMVGGGENGHGAAVAVGFAASAVAAAVLVWLALRLSMAAPMTFVDNQFRLFESWALTKGQGWRLLGMALLIVVFALGLQILFGGVLLGVGIAAGGSLAALRGEGALEAFLARPPLEWLTVLWPVLAGGGAILAVFSAVIQTVVYAPWAAAHRALTTEA